MKKQNEALTTERKRLEQRATQLAESLAVIILLYYYNCSQTPQRTAITEQQAAMQDVRELYNRTMQALIQPNMMHRFSSGIKC